MKKILIPLQILACCSLAAQEVVAAKSPQKTQKDATCASGRCSSFQQGDDALQALPMTSLSSAATNQVGGIAIDRSWQLYGDVSYLYWEPTEEGLDIGVPGYLFEDFFWRPSTGNASAFLQDSNYTSGFRLGVGANLEVDGWSADLEYTYLRQHTKSSGAAPASDANPADSSAKFNFSGWFWPSAYGQGVTGDSFSSKWKLGVDWLDLSVSRPYYQGRRLVVAPSAGLRASWIRQRLTVFSPSIASGTDGSALKVTSTNASHAWAIGPRATVDAHWLLGAGFRLQGDVGGSLLFTQFTNVSHREPSLHDTGGDTGAIEFHLTNYNCLRPALEANLGIGWGGYYFHNHYHFDLAAIYDFNYLWGQNMMRYLTSLNAGVGRSGVAGDLILQGLEIKGRFDF